MAYRTSKPIQWEAFGQPYSLAEAAADIAANRPQPLLGHTLSSAYSGAYSAVRAARTALDVTDGQES